MPPKKKSKRGGFREGSGRYTREELGLPRVIMKSIRMEEPVEERFSVLCQNYKLSQRNMLAKLVMEAPIKPKK